VIFYDIAGFERRGFVQIISINRNPDDIWFLPGDICKIHFVTQPQHVGYPPIDTL